jgi:hypothetical protein
VGRIFGSKGDEKQSYLYKFRRWDEIRNGHEYYQIAKAKLHRL